MDGCGVFTTTGYSRRVEKNSFSGPNISAIEMANFLVKRNSLIDNLHYLGFFAAEAPTAMVGMIVGVAGSAGRSNTVSIR